MLQGKEYKAVPTERLAKTARFVLENNYLEFNGDVKKQISGTTVGTKLPPPQALYLSMILKPNIYNPKHYNLCYGLDTSLAFSLFGLMAKTNVKSSQKAVTILIITFNLPMNPVKRMSHLIAKLSKCRLTSDLHIKDIDRHQYLHFNFSHPDHTKRSIIYSQTLRLTKICTFENNF